MTMTLMKAFLSFSLLVSLASVVESWSLLPDVARNFKVARTFDPRNNTAVPNKEETLCKEFHTGSFYWYGKDKDGTPTLWYRIDCMEWESIVFTKRMQYTDLVLKSVLQKIPSEYKNLNFVLVVDDFSPIQMIKHPKIGPAFLKSFVKSCPEDRLKRAVMVTGTSGYVFYNIVKSIAPKKLINKIMAVKSREVAASVLVDEGIVRNQNELPDFLGGKMIHDEKRTKSLSGMMSTLK